MKKFFMMALLATLTISASAQLVTSSRVARGARAHNLWVDLGAGFGTQSGAEGVNFDLGLRYNKMFTENIGWDILKIGVTTNSKDFGESINLQALTGVRYVTPVLFGNSSAYANVAVGYDYSFNAEDGAFAWEIGAGLKVTPRFTVGVAYNSVAWSGSSAGSIGLRLGLAL